MPILHGFARQLGGSGTTRRGLGANIAAVAKAPIERVAAFAAHRGWRNLKLLSAAANSFKRDYHGEDEEGQQVPILTVFQGALTG